MLLFELDPYHLHKYSKVDMFSKILDVPTREVGNKLLIEAHAEDKEPEGISITLRL